VGTGKRRRGIAWIVLSHKTRPHPWPLGPDQAILGLARVGQKQGRVSMGLGRHGMARDGKYEPWQEWPRYSAGARANWTAAARGQLPGRAHAWPAQRPARAASPAASAAGPSTRARACARGPGPGNGLRAPGTWSAAPASARSGQVMHSLAPGQILKDSPHP
jgi:hypothetical protein